MIVYLGVLECVDRNILQLVCNSDSVLLVMTSVVPNNITTYSLEID